MITSAAVPQTRVVIFQQADGTVPLVEWLASIPRKAAFKCIARVERLRAMGHELRRPEADLLRDGIYELRVGFQGVNYRMLYFFHGTVAAVISHGTTKEAAVPPVEIDRALRRRTAFLADPAKHSYSEPL